MKEDALTGSLRLYVYGITAVAAVSGLLFGFDTAVINGALVFLREQFKLTDGQTEVAAGSLLLGCVFGSSAAGGLTDAQGRKKVLLAAATLFSISSLCTALPRNLTEFVVARFVAGLAIGVSSVLSPMYIAEVSPAQIRGRLVTLNQMAIVTGILCAYFVNWRLSGLGAQSWRWMFASAAIPSLIFFAALLRIPESPRWLVSRGRESQAFEILKRIGGEIAARTEIFDIGKSLAKDAGSFRGLLAPELRRPLYIAIVLAVMSQVTGINTVIYYGSILLKEHAGHTSASSAIGANVIIGLTNLLCTIVATLVIDRVGRKVLLLFGSAGMGVSLAMLAAALGGNPPPANLIVILLLAYVAFFAVSLGPGTWVYIAELFPTGIRGRAMSLATLSLWLACLAVTLSFLTLVRILSAAGAFWVYSALCFITFGFVWICVPETNRLALEEIQSLWMPRGGKE
jgi:sugar porter (SP) family MFS transporter